MRPHSKSQMKYLLRQARVGGAASGARRMAAQLGEGFAAIAGSRYLLTLAAYLLLSTATSSLLYFLKAAVLAEAAPDAGGRMALVAAINSASASIIAVLQVPAPSRNSGPLVCQHCIYGLGCVRAARRRTNAHQISAGWSCWRAPVRRHCCSAGAHLGFDGVLWSFASALW